jgi:hypothetical protein
MHERIQAEFNIENETESSVTTITSAPIRADIPHLIEKKQPNHKDKQKKTKDPHKNVNILQKSEKMKQLEAFEQEREAAAREKRRQARIEKEAKREVRDRE